MPRSARQLRRPLRVGSTQTCEGKVVDMEHSVEFVAELRVRDASSGPSEPEGEPSPGNELVNGNRPRPSPATAGPAPAPRTTYKDLGPAGKRWEKPHRRPGGRSGVIGDGDAGGGVGEAIDEGAGGAAKGPPPTS